MTNFVSLTWSEWETAFSPISNHLSSTPDEQMFETFGDEWEFIKSQDPHNVWTWVSGEGCDLLVNGIAYINRIGYYITADSWKDDTEYEILISKEVECECYQEDGYEDGEYGRADCQECEGSGMITEYVE
jgi:hypothetical protein